MHAIYRVLTALILTTSALPAEAFAQVASTAQREPEAVSDTTGRLLREQNVVRAIPFVPTAIRPPASLISFRASRNEGDKVAGVEVQLPELPNANLKLGISAPLQAGQTGPVLLGDLKGLHDATKVTLAASSIRWFRRDSTQLRRAFCNQIGVDPDSACIPPNHRRSHPEEYAAYRSQIQNVLKGNPMLFGLQGEYGRQSFRYRDADFASHEVERAGFSLDAAVGWYYRAVGLVSVGGRYENAYQGSKARQICFPLTTGSTALQCETTALSAPVRSKTFVGTLELRRYLGSSLGINPSVSYRSEGSSWGVQVPLYFAPDEKNRLIGGVIPSWNSLDRKFVVSFFVGQTFGLKLPI